MSALAITKKSFLPQKGARGPAAIHEPARLAKVGERFDAGDTWRCGCGREHRFGAYAAAHWHIELGHTCPCGAKRDFRGGVVLAANEAVAT